MALYGWPNCPAPARAQLDRLALACADALSTNLVGVYLHGSLALGSFSPHRSDLDLLVISAAPMPIGIRRHLVEFLLTCSRQPHPIEISFLSRGQLQPWRYPPPFDLHYSEAWRESYAADLRLGAWHGWGARVQCDPDLAAHITVVRARGVCLAGAPIAAVFPAVPDADYQASLAGDIAESLAAIARDPVYTILNCCRTYAYSCDGQIRSKVEGGRWALGVLPAEHHAAIDGALAAYGSAAGAPRFDPDALLAFAAYMRQCLAPILQQRAAE